MLDAIFDYVKQMDSSEFYKFCSEIFYRAESGVYSDDSASPRDRPTFIGLMAEIIDAMGGAKDGNR